MLLQALHLILELFDLTREITDRLLHAIDPGHQLGGGILGILGARRMSAKQATEPDSKT